jgi:hypothetical protein
MIQDASGTVSPLKELTTSLTILENSHLGFIKVFREPGEREISLSLATT